MSLWGIDAEFSIEEFNEFIKFLKSQLCFREFSKGGSLRNSLCKFTSRQTFEKYRADVWGIRRIASLNSSKVSSVVENSQKSKHCVIHYVKLLQSILLRNTELTSGEFDESQSVVATWRSVLQCVAVCRSVSQCVAVSRSVSQCVAVCRSVSQCVAVWCSVSQCVAVCCSVSQCVAVCRSMSWHSVPLIQARAFFNSKLYMGWLRSVGSLKLWVSYANEPYKRDHILHKRPIILRSVLIVATP